MNKGIFAAFAGVAHLHAEEYARCLSNNPHVERIAVWDEDIERMESFAKRHNMWAVPTLELLLAENPDFMLICSENMLHKDIALKIAPFGIPTLCEKPLGTTRADMEAMLLAYEESGGRLMTAFPNRFLDSVTRVRQALIGGELGDIIAIKATNRGKMPGGFFVEPALSGGGAMMDHIVHVADLLHWFLGKSPQWVQAFANTLFYPDLKVEDAAIVHMRFEDGMPVTLDSSWSLCQNNPGGRDLTMDILGTKGSLRLDIVEGHHAVLSARSEKRVLFDIAEDKNQRMIDAAVGCVISGEPFPVTGEDGYRAAVVALSAIESRGKTSPVTVIF